MAENNASHSEKLGIKGVLGIGLACLLLLVFAVTYGTTTATRQVPSSTSDVTVFQTGGGSVVFAVLATAYGFLILAFGLYVGFLSFGHARQTGMKDIAFGLLLVCGTLGFGGGVVWYNGFRPYSVRVSIDKHRHVIAVNKHSLLRSEKSLQMAFSDIQHLVYRCTEVRGEHGPVAWGTVEITKGDGATIQVSEEDKPGAQLRLAEAIAEATGKPLRRE